jgi:hypothetical protein
MPQCTRAVLVGFALLTWAGLVHASKQLEVSETLALFPVRIQSKTATFEQMAERIYRDYGCFWDVSPTQRIFHLGEWVFATGTAQNSPEFTLSQRARNQLILPGGTHRLSYRQIREALLDHEPDDIARADPALAVELEHLSQLLDHLDHFSGALEFDAVSPLEEVVLIPYVRRAAVLRTELQNHFEGQVMDPNRLNFAQEVESELAARNPTAAIIAAQVDEGTKLMSLRSVLSHAVEYHKIPDAIDQYLGVKRAWDIGDLETVHTTLSQIAIPEVAISPLVPSAPFDFCLDLMVLGLIVAAGLAIYSVKKPAPIATITGLIIGGGTWLLPLVLPIAYTRSSGWVFNYLESGIWALAILPPIAFLSKDKTLWATTGVSSVVVFALLRYHFPWWTTGHIAGNGVLGSLAAMWTGSLVVVCATSLVVALLGVFQLVMLASDRKTRKDAIQLNYRYENRGFNSLFFGATILTGICGLLLAGLFPFWFSILNPVHLMLLAIWLLRFHYPIELKSGTLAAWKLGAFLTALGITSVAAFFLAAEALQQIKPSYVMWKMDLFWVSVLLCITILLSLFCIVPSSWLKFRRSVGKPI